MAEAAGVEMLEVCNHARNRSVACMHGVDDGSGHRSVWGLNTVMTDSIIFHQLVK